MPERDAWAEINLGAYEHNFNEIRKCVAGNAKLCAVVKADAYGHGAIPIAKKVVELGADVLAVAVLSEALELRRAGFTQPILILGLSPVSAVQELVDCDITQAVCTMPFAKALSAEAVRQKKKAKIHLKVDTGMARIGIRPEEAAAFAKDLQALPGLELEGMFSHFASADTRDKSSAREQLARFRTAIDAIEAEGIHIPMKHIAESAAILELPEAHLDMVRIGIIQYGLWPSAEVERKISLHQVMRLCARIAFVKEMQPGETVGYGCDFTVHRPSRIATMPLGYADGYIRAYAGKASVEICGKRAPVVGRVCMDQFMADVTDIPEAEEGTEAVLFGSDALTTDEAASWLNTINYEVTCLVSPRVPRVYVMR